jgi:S1-C subfamily serine protease
MKREAILIGGVLAFLVAGFQSCFGVSPERIYKEANSKVVMIHTITATGGGECSGEFISKNGNVLTCAHCFEHTPKKIFVKDAEGMVSIGKIIKIDQRSDLALLDTRFERRPYFKLGRGVKVGQQVFALGSPLGIQNTMSVGWVENTRTESRRIILHSAFINPGNSGGPLVDTHGRLVGVNEAIIMENILQAAQALYIAIDGSEVKEFLR